MAIFSLESSRDYLVSGPQAIRRILIPCGWLGAVAATVIWVLFSSNHAVAFIGGALVGCANLVFLTLLVQQILIPAKSRNYVMIASVMAIKLIVVYGGLAALLIWEVTPIVSVACGFSLILVVITLKAFGRALLGSGLLESGKPNGTENHHSDAK